MEELISILRNRISDNSEFYINNETAVRRQLIEPMLSFLGWEIEDPKFVKHNDKSYKGDIPDYTLFADNKPITFIEAKNLGTDIIEHVPQLARYCFNKGIEFGIITNGDYWLLLKTYEPGIDLKDRIVFLVSILNDDSSAIKIKLENISFENIREMPLWMNMQRARERYWDSLISGKSNFLEVLVDQISADFIKNCGHEDLDKLEMNRFFKEKFEEAFNNKMSSISIQKTKVKSSKTKTIKRSHVVKDAIIEQKFLTNIPDEAFVWFTNIQLNKRYNKADLFKQFGREVRKWANIQRNTWSRWLKSWCSYNNYLLNSHKPKDGRDKSNGIEYVTIREKS